MESIDPYSLSRRQQGGVIAIVFADFPYKTTLEKQKAFFAIARKCAKEQQDTELRQIAFIVEAWLSRESCNAPSKDPKRKEALCIWTLDVDGAKITQGGHMAEIIRHGDIVDLAPYENYGEVHNKILLAFLAGFVSGQMPDEQLAQIMKRL